MRVVSGALVSRLKTHDSRLTTHDSRLTTHDSRLTTGELRWRQCVEQPGARLIRLEGGRLSLARHGGPAAEGVGAELRGGFGPGLAAGQRGVLGLEGGLQAGLDRAGPHGENVAIELVGEVHELLAGDGGAADARR